MQEVWAKISRQRLRLFRNIHLSWCLPFAHGACSGSRSAHGLVSGFLDLFSVMRRRAAAMLQAAACRGLKPLAKRWSESAEHSWTAARAEGLILARVVSFSLSWIASL